MPDKPDILQTEIVAESKLFCIESVELAFANGAHRTYERIRGKRRLGAVMVVPVTAQNEVILVKEYVVGTESYEIGCPKGLLEYGESPLAAANRELMEEIGYGAHDLSIIKHLSTAPGYVAATLPVVLARDLYAHRLPGDEPEPLEVIHWPLADLSGLLDREDVTEARSIAALYLTQTYLRGVLHES